MDVKKKILVVEDDEFLSKTIYNVLRAEYEIVLAPNGISGREIMMLQNFDLVLSDIQMPKFSGIELLEWSQKNKPIPFVIMTGFSTLLETRTAQELGAKGFIAKPFVIEDLRQLLKSLLKTSEVPVGEAKKDISSFCKVSIEEFVSKPKIEFDVYIRITDKNIFKIAKTGDELPRAQLSHYKEKGVKHLYILKEDFGKLIDFNLDLAKIMKNRNDVSPEKKAAFLKYTGEVLLEKTFTDGVASDKLDAVNSFLNLTFDMLADSKESFDLLGVLSLHSDEVYVHSIAASMYSVLIAKQMGIQSNRSLFKLSMAGFFHDIGKKEIDKEVLQKPRHLVTKEERALIESHVIRGTEILMGMKDIPPDVARIVSEHHEDSEGTGYPFRKSRKDQHPLSRIVQCANIFIDQVNIVKSQGKPVVAAGVLQKIESLYGPRVDAESLSALKKIFNVNAS